jgi:hypothetical protein
MTAFRILDQSPVFFDLLGAIAAGGSLQFYAAGTTTPKDVYGDQALTVNNGDTIAIGADGRAVDDIWGDGSYRVRVYAADSTLISDDDNVEIPGGTGQVIPTLADGQFISALGGVLVAADVEQVPDPAGQSGKWLSSDGTNAIWATAPAAPTAPITVGTADVQFGSTGGKAFFIQYGTATAPASGTYSTTKAVTFATAFNSTPVVMLDMTSNSQPGGPVVAQLSAAPTSTGFTAVFDVAEGNPSQSSFVNDAPFNWVAFGLINV